jgi:excinuclease UvrABC ATPase subunit
VPEARIQGYKPGRFSFNVKRGRCETCEGGGKRLIEMNFLPNVYVHCEKCQGTDNYLLLCHAKNHPTSINQFPPGHQKVAALSG